jgi:hypothetical protein
MPEEHEDMKIDRGSVGRRKEEGGGTIVGNKGQCQRGSEKKH